MSISQILGIILTVLGIAGGIIGVKYFIDYTSGRKGEKTKKEIIVAVIEECRNAKTESGNPGIITWEKPLKKPWTN